MHKLTTTCARAWRAHNNYLDLSTVVCMGQGLAVQIAENMLKFFLALCKSGQGCLKEQLTCICPMAASAAGRCTNCTKPQPLPGGIFV